MISISLIFCVISLDEIPFLKVYCIFHLRKYFLNKTLPPPHVFLCSPLCFLQPLPSRLLDGRQEGERSRLMTWSKRKSPPRRGRDERVARFGDLETLGDFVEQKSGGSNAGKGES